MQSPLEPFLFDVPLQVEKTDVRRRAKTVIAQLYKVRRSMKLPEDEFFYKAVTRLCDEIRAFDRMSDTQREELILYAIERQGATTPREIAEDTKLRLADVKAVLEKLRQDGTVYDANRHVPLSDRQWTMIKSARNKTPEVE